MYLILNICYNLTRLQTMLALCQTVYKSILLTLRKNNVYLHNYTINVIFVQLHMHHVPWVRNKYIIIVIIWFRYMRRFSHQASVHEPSSPPPPPDERKYTSADHQTAPGLKKTKMFLPHPRVKVSIVGSLRDREVACSASDHQGFNFESCVWRTVSSQSSHHPQEVLLAQFSLYVHKGGLKPDLFIFLSDGARFGFVTEAFVYLCLKATQ